MKKSFAQLTNQSTDQILPKDFIEARRAEATPFEDIDAALISHEKSPLMAKRNWKGGGSGSGSGDGEARLENNRVKYGAARSGEDDSWILSIGEPANGRVSVTLKPGIDKEEALI